MLRRLAPPLFCAAALVLSVALLARAQEPAATGDVVRLRIVHTNDLHGHVEKAAAIAAVAKRSRRVNPNTLFLDGGDCISGTPLSTVFEGRPIFEIMSRMGYDAAVLGNHEFDHGWDRIRGFAELADFPLLCANAKDPEGRPFGDAPYKVFEVGGLRIGVIGLLTDGVPHLTTKAASEGCSFESPLAAARRPGPRGACEVRPGRAADARRRRRGRRDRRRRRRRRPSSSAGTRTREAEEGPQHQRHAHRAGAVLRTTGRHRRDRVGPGREAGDRVRVPPREPRRRLAAPDRSRRRRGRGASGRRRSRTR